MPTYDSQKLTVFIIHFHLGMCFQSAGSKILISSRQLSVKVTATCTGLFYRTGCRASQIFHSHTEYYLILCSSFLINWIAQKQQIHAL
jgi:hypothetical protein